MYELCYKMRQNNTMKSEKTRLAIFDTFKTKRKQITGEANRQRAIIHHSVKFNEFCIEDTELLSLKA